MHIITRRGPLTNKEVIYRAVESMDGVPFTAYDIRDRCNRDLSLQAISCVIRGMRGIHKIDAHKNSCYVWLWVKDEA